MSERERFESLSPQVIQREIMQRNLKLALLAPDSLEASKLAAELTMLKSLVQPEIRPRLRLRKPPLVIRPEPPESILKVELPPLPLWIKNKEGAMAQDLTYVWYDCAPILKENQDRRFHHYQSADLPRIRQVPVEGRLTCVPAAIQMLMLYAGIIDREKLFSALGERALVRLKRRMLHTADTLEFLRPGPYTIDINATPDLQNQWLAETSAYLKSHGYQAPIPGKVECLWCPGKEFGLDGILSEIIKGTLSNEQCCYAVTCANHEKFIEGIEIGNPEQEEPRFLMYDTLSLKQEFWPLSKLRSRLQPQTRTIYRGTREQEIKFV